MALLEATESYLAELRVTGRSATTVNVQGCMLRQLSKELGPQRPVASVGRSDVVGYLNRLVDRGLSQRYVVTNVKVYRPFFGWLTDRGEIKQNPLAGFKISEPPDEPVPPFTDDEYRRLIAAADTLLKKAVLLILIDTGLRRAEVCSLRLASVDFQTHELTVRGKGNKVRRVAMSPLIEAAIKDYLASRAQVDGTLWPGEWTPATINGIIDSIAKKARVARVYPHRFRHSWAGKLACEGVDVLVLQRLLGHSSLKTTARYLLWAEEGRSLDVHRQHSIVPAA